LTIDNSHNYYFRFVLNKIPYRFGVHFTALLLLNLQWLPINGNVYSIYIDHE